VSEVRVSSRRRSREVALQVLYAIDLARTRTAGTSDESQVDPNAAREVFESVAAHFEMPAGAKSFALELVCEVCLHADALDTRVTAHTRNWRLSRMAAVDRNILRLGCYELTHTETPTAVVVNEAVELARHFGADASPAFVNGVLDAVGRGRSSADTVRVAERGA